ncbi:MAG TPA: VWA domain-containing protein [Thermoanaerobaculia bacterium]
MQTTTLRLFSLLALLLAGALSAVAEESAPDFGEVIDVRVVNVEAVVTNRKGEPVRGLSAADFRLLVDGKEVPVDYFAEVKNGAAAVPPAKGPDEGPQAPMSGTVGRSILVFLDESSSLARDLDQVLPRLQEHVKGLGSEDRMAIVAFDGDRLTILSGWTRDEAALRKALDAARARPAQGIRVRAERRSLKNDQELLQQAAALGDVFSAGSFLDDDVDLSSGRSALEFIPGSSLEGPGVPWQSYAQMLRAGDSVVATLQGFSAVPGRKIALLLSGGWPTELEPVVFARTIEAANMLGYTLYPVDVAGVETSPSPVDASQHGPYDTGVSGPGIQTASLGGIASPWEKEVHYGLELLARETGGKASLNSNRMAALDRMLEDTSEYYWLGFSPSWKADGRRHEIRLEVRRPGLKVRARRSYSDLSPEAEKALQAGSLLLIGGSSLDEL